MIFLKKWSWNFSDFSRKQKWKKNWFLKQNFFFRSPPSSPLFFYLVRKKGKWKPRKVLVFVITWKISVKIKFHFKSILCVGGKCWLKKKLTSPHFNRYWICPFFEGTGRLIFSYFSPLFQLSGRPREKACVIWAKVLPNWLLESPIKGYTGEKAGFSLKTTFRLDLQRSLRNFSSQIPLNLHLKIPTLRYQKG